MKLIHFPTHTLKAKHSGTIIFLLLILLLNWSCRDRGEIMMVSQKSPEQEAWIHLFDGSGIDGWREYNNEELPLNWIIEGGNFKSIGANRDIIFTKEQFKNFELKLEWKIGKEGNSGIFYHVVEGDQYKAIYETAPEYQLIDDIGYPGVLNDWQKTGADYAMYTADEDQKILKPIGEWNSSSIKFTAEKVEHWLNGKKLFEFVPWSEDWYSRKESGKWKDYPDYGEAKSGFIGLQDHGNEVWFRNIRIRHL